MRPPIPVNIMSLPSKIEALERKNLRTDLPEFRVGDAVAESARLGRWVEVDRSRAHRPVSVEAS